ncbi:MAG: hypothetical protein ACLUFH_00450 [Monoglobales bacterium]
MRLEPSEEFMYRRMDRKDRLMFLIPVWGIGASAGLLFIASGNLWIAGVAMVVIAMAAMLITWLAYRRVKGIIMPVSSCFLEIQSTCFVAVQPYRNEIYESCRIYFSEIETLVMSRRRTGFYIQISESGKSIIQRKDRGRVMYVGQDGYSKENLEAVYQKIRERVPETAKVYEYTKIES